MSGLLLIAKSLLIGSWQHLLLLFCFGHMTLYVAGICLGVSSTSCDALRRRYLHGCELYGLVPAEVRVADQPTDPTTRRQQKIDRLRKEKAAKARLEALQVPRLRVCYTFIQLLLPAIHNCDSLVVLCACVIFANSCLCPHLTTGTRL